MQMFSYLAGANRFSANLLNLSGKLILYITISVQAV
jgi:hypothetical protein